MNNIPDYIVLTEKSLYDVWSMCEENITPLEKLWAEQDTILERNGFDLDKSYNMHFFESKFMYDSMISKSIHSAIELLAIKDGVDLVQFEGGNYGFVSYYNGHESAFEILNEDVESEE